jgi:imidazoleglycerol phosphate synthase glutamine amidotransferase subunit HisH
MSDDDPQPVLKRVGNWNVTLQQQHDITQKWRADATYYFGHDFACGMDAAQALTTLAGKIGENPTDMLKEFGL